MQNKILGSWMGLAIGEAMGSSVRGMKPATILQCFNKMDDYKDVRPFIGKGVKQYKMKGLYGSQTQVALAACEVLLRHKKIDPEVFLTSLFELRKNGPELYFGVFRRPETCLRKALELLAGSLSLPKANTHNATSTFLTLSVPIALYNRDQPKSIIQNILKVGQTLNCHILELAGMLIVGGLIEQFLKYPSKFRLESDPIMPKSILTQTLQLAKEAKGILNQIPTLLDNKEVQTALETLYKTLSWIEKNYKKGEEKNILLNGVCEKASENHNYKISHAGQGTHLALLPTAVLMTLQGNDFASILTQALHLGGEGDKLGAIIGALTGALYGFEQIPEGWRKGLVNSKEIKLWGEALINKKPSSKMQNLFEMEARLTFKEAEERKRFLSRESKKKSNQINTQKTFPLPVDLPFPQREDRQGRRQYEREKSRKKRDRRKN